METKNEDMWEREIKQLIKEGGLETPSEYFTQTVIEKIAREGSTEITAYKPLISKTTWAVLSLLVLAGVGFGYFTEAETRFAWLDYLGTEVFEKMGVIQLPELSLSNTLLYALLALGFFLYLQFFMLQKHLSKKYSLQ